MPLKQGTPYRPDVVGKRALVRGMTRTRSEPCALLPNPINRESVLRRKPVPTLLRNARYDACQASDKHGSPEAVFCKAWKVPRVD